MIVDRSPEQVGFYDRGLGTGWRKFTGSVAGAGISRNIRECYEFIFENFCAGDEIYLFGFSRGAATVRSLSGFLHMFGVLPKSRPELIGKAYRIYKSARSGSPRQREKRRQRAADFVSRHHTMWTRVKFLGVWDTVAALGVPIRSIDVLLSRLPGFKHRFHDFELSECVEHARHALAIDDERKTFHPLLWDAKTRAYQTMKQVWFAGMHTDVGGGYPRPALSDIALDWMVKEAEQSGLLIYPGHDVTTNPDPDGHMHDSRSGFPGFLFRRETRFWPDGRTDKPVVHASVLKRTRNRHNTEQPPYKPWLLDLDTDIEE
jgi:uncharacterized protein (DUF2235 family)